MMKIHFFLLTMLVCGVWGIALTACTKDDEDPLKGKTPDQIEWIQHEYGVTMSGTSLDYPNIKKWSGYYASIFEVWTGRGDKDQKGPRFFLSHYRWFPAEYGPTFWTEKLDQGDWYYENRYSSHTYETKTLANGQVEMTVEMQGHTWTGNLTEKTVTFETEDGCIMTLTPLPDTPYDGSYNDILEEIL